MTLKYPKELHRILNLWGFNFNESKVAIRGKLMVLMSLYFFAHTMASMISNWNNLTIRFKSIEHICLEVAVTSLMIMYAVNKGNIQQLIVSIEAKYYRYYFLSVEIEEELERSTVDSINNGTRILIWIRSLEFISLISEPLIYVAYHVILSDRFRTKPFQIQDIPLPLTFNQKGITLFNYTIVLVGQIIYSFNISSIGFCVYSSIIFGSRRLTSEATLFTIMLKQLNEKLENIEQQNKAPIHLQTALRHVITHHNQIYRKCKRLNKSLQTGITIANNALTFLICLSIYSFVKIDNSLLRVKYLIQIIVCVIVTFIYSFNGQGLKNMGEEIHEALTNFTWYDKPEWFKKNFLLMLIRAQTKLEVKPFGLYVVDLRNFSMAMNAAYSYFNVFKRL